MIYTPNLIQILFQFPNICNAFHVNINQTVRLIYISYVRKYNVLFFHRKKWLIGYMRHIPNNTFATSYGNPSNKMANIKSSQETINKMVNNRNTSIFFHAIIFISTILIIQPSADAQRTPTISYITPNIISKVLLFNIDDIFAEANSKVLLCTPFHG